MYDDWFVLEFPSVQQESTLSLFPKEASQYVTDVLMREVSDFVEKSGKTERGVLPFETEDHLSWIMQVISYAISLSYTPNNEYESLRAAVRTYITWCSILTKEPHPSIPRPLKADPERYTREMIWALRIIFTKQNTSKKIDSLVLNKTNLEADVGIKRQAQEIQTILKGIASLTSNCLEKHQSFVQNISLQFLLNSSDLLLAGQAVEGDISSVMAQDVIQTLFDEFLRGARLEQIPSPSYWKTLSVLCKRWRHQVSLVENWARKVLALSVLIVRELFGSQYSTISLTDKEVLEFLPLVGIDTKKDTFSSLHLCWFQMLHLLGNPAEIVDYNPCKDAAVSHNFIEALLAAGGRMDENGKAVMKIDNEELTPYTIGRLRQCFFLACAAVFKLINVFYGDPQVSIEFRESENLIKQWEEANRLLNENWLRRRQLPPSGSVTGGSNILKSAFGLQSGSHSVRSRPSSDRSLNANQGTVSTALTSGNDMPAEIVKPTASQFVWSYLKDNPMYPAFVGACYPKITSLLDLFMDWLVRSALVRSPRMPCSDVTSDVTSQHSMSSVGAEETEGAASNGDGQGSATESGTTARSFARSTASSSDVNSVVMPSVDWPGVDGISAGRSAAVGALCRIICSKNSRETLSDLQLAQFYKVIYEALQEKDRLVLCSLIYYGGSMFGLGLKGIEILLPLFVLAVDIVLTESTKLRLHPSISEVEMRRACLQAFSTVLAWPTTFGSTRIPDPSYGLSSASWRNVSEEHSIAYIELLPRIHRNLIYSLRHETDPSNLHLTLAMCNILCEESCMFDRSFTGIRQPSGSKKPATSTVDEDEEKDYCVSVIRSVVSAICDNICKPQWSTDLSICLAAIDCLNAIASLHPSALFYRKDMSTGFLIVTSLCRFIDMQLTKPPPFHSRDLHSSVVAAFSSLVVWLCAAPNLVETESCLTNVAEVIEFGLTGGKNLPITDIKPASKRVHDAAEHLLYNLLSSVSRGRQKEIVDERTLLCRYGSEVIDLSKFKHFLVKQDTLLSIHDASNIPSISPGQPALFFVVRSPYHSAVAALTRLLSQPADNGEATEEKEHDSARPEERLPSSETKSLPSKNFEIPAGFDKPRCKLDSVIPQVQSTSETDRILTELNEIRRKIQLGESVVRSSDERNVWLHEPFASILTKPLQPIPPPEKCDAGRVFLYDMGFVSEATFNAGEFIMLTSEKNEEFYRALHQMVDRSPTKLLQSVCIFYVRAEQHNASEILENAVKIENMCAEFCQMLSELGEGVDVSTHPHWTGNWATAFSSERKDMEDRKDDRNYVIDGLSHCLWWTDSQVEVTYTMPSERCMKASGAYHVSPPTIVCSFDEVADSEQNFPSKKLQHHLSIASGSMSTLSPPAYRQHSFYSPNHSLSISPLSTASSSSSGLAPPNVHAQLPISSRRKSLLAIASPNIFVCGNSDLNKDDLIAMEGKHPLLFPSIKDRRSSRSPRTRSKSRTIECRLPKNDRSRNSFTASNPDFQLVPSNMENDYADDKNEKSIKRQRAFSGNKEATSPRKGPLVCDRPKTEKYQLLIPRSGVDLRKRGDTASYASHSIPLSIFDMKIKKLFYSSNEGGTLSGNRGCLLHTPVRPTYSLQAFTNPNSPRFGILGQKRSWTTDDSDVFVVNLAKERASFGLFKSFFRRRTSESPSDLIYGFEPYGNGICDNPGVESLDIRERKKKTNLDFEKEVKPKRNSISEGTLQLHHSSSEEYSSEQTISGKLDETAGKSQTIRTKSVSVAYSMLPNVHGSSPDGQFQTWKRNADQRVFVIWLERIEDMYHFPIEEMFAVSGDGSPNAYGFPSRPDYIAIFICQVEDGLAQINIKGNFTKCGLPGPLFNGCVVSNSSLPALLRLTVISIARRKTLELENYHMVYSRRRQAIQEFAKKYAVELQSYVDVVERLVAP